MNDVGQRPRALPSLVFEDLEGSDEVVVVDPERDVAVALNQTAAAVLELCDGTRTPETIAVDMAEIWSLAPEAIMADLEEILAEFNDCGLVSWE